MVALANALESQVEVARRKQRLREEAERRRPAPRRLAVREPEQRMGQGRPWGRSIGEELSSNEVVELVFDEPIPADLFRPLR